MAAVKVRALALGFWDNTRRRPGAVFEVPEEFADIAKWYERVDGAPGKPKKKVAPLVTPPGNANAHHVPGSPAAEAARRPASSAAAVKSPVEVTEEARQPQSSGDKKVI